MRYPVPIFLLILLAVVIPVAEGLSAAEAAEEPTAVVLATVNGEPITLDDLVRKVALFHAGMAQASGLSQSPDVGAILDRLVNSTMILQEARAIGLDQLPEVQARIEEGRMDILRRAIAEKAVEGIEAGDPAVAEELYRNAVRRVEIKTLVLPTVREAAEFSDEVKGGEDFESLAARWIEAGRTKGNPEVGYLKASELQPHAKAAVMAVEVGEATLPIQVEGGFAVVKLVGSDYPDDPEARATAARQALEMRQAEALRTYTDEMIDRYVDLDREFVEDLDFDGAGEVGLKALRTDTRVIATVKGGDPITVADLTEYLENKFFHGMERAVGRKRVNEDLIGGAVRLSLLRAAEIEAARIGILDSKEFEADVANFTDQLIFSAFFTKVIHPDLKIEDEELRALYDKDIDLYSSPEMIRVDSLVYRRREDAESAVEKLRKGSDLDWMRANSDGQITEEDEIEFLNLRGSILVESTLPPAIRAALTGAEAGEYRFFGPDPGPYYALQVQARYPATPKSFEEVRDSLTKQLIDEERREAIDSYTEQMREASEIEILIDAEEASRLLGLAAGVDS